MLRLPQKFFNRGIGPELAGGSIGRGRLPKVPLIDKGEGVSRPAELESQVQKPEGLTKRERE